MNNRNINFVNNPIGFLNNNTVNHRWFDEHIQRLNNGNAPLADQNSVRMLPLAKVGSFDMQPVAGGGGRPQVQFAPIPNYPVMDVLLQGYWCPYVHGLGLPGFVDVPRLNPAHRFVFTAAMNGCAFIVTDSPLGGGHFRVYHHQHPGNAGINAQIAAVTPNVLSVFAFADYGNAAPPGGLPVAFNFLYYRNARWVIVSHSTAMNPATGAIAHDPAMPLLVVDANV